MTDTDPQSFAAFLCQHGKGRSEKELSERLTELVQAVLETGKPGSITYTLTIRPLPKADQAMTVGDSIKVKIPELARPEPIFFVDDAKHLVRTDPRQLSFDSLTQENAK